MIDLENGDLIDSFPNFEKKDLEIDYAYYCPSNSTVQHDGQTWNPLDKFYTMAVSNSPRFRTGDKVYHGRDEGLIASVYPPSNWGDWEERYSYEVIFADPSIPRAVIQESQLTNYALDSNGSIIRCECGVDSVSGGIHSDWCPKSIHNIRRL